MTIRTRVELYKTLFKNSVAVAPVKELIEGDDINGSPLDALEAIRKLNVALSDAYQVSIPVITVWVRDYSYVPETGEIYLTEPEVENFLHQFRHHLQNVERKYERRGLTAEEYKGKPEEKLIYTETVHRLYGEDDARAWSKAIMELALGQ